MRDLLVTGTDTGVGQDGDCRGARDGACARAGVRAIGFKPAETGVDADQDTDSEVLADASGEHDALAAPLLQLAEPLAPAVAAERAGVALESRRHRSAHQTACARDGYTVVVEGAGGVMVPLALGLHRRSTWPRRAISMRSSSPARASAR